MATAHSPCFVAGPHDTLDRFTWWVRRASRGGRVTLPGQPDQPVQVLDVHDLAALVWQLLADDRPGVFNAAGPAEPTTMAGLIEARAEAAGVTVEIVPVEANPELPPLPYVDGSPVMHWLYQLDSARARKVGLPSTPLATTAAEILAWDRGRGEPPLNIGLTPQQEAEFLDA